MYLITFVPFNRESNDEESSDVDDDADGVNEDAIDDGTYVSVVKCFN